VSAAPGAFDQALVVDWSAAGVPTTGADSIWIARGALHQGGRTQSKNFATRFEAAAALERRLSQALEQGKRTLVAIDVSFGFPAGAVRLLGLPGRPPWRALWSALEEQISDDAVNKNNRFELADAWNAACGMQVFWGRPVAASFDHLRHLPLRKVEVAGLAPNPLPRLRTCEELAGPGVISNWMLIGKGAVGGQMLTCLPMLERLRQRFGPALKVWPFEGLGDPGGQILMAETWFGLFDWRRAQGSCRDERQVRGTLAALRSLGPEGLAELLDPRSLAALSARRHREILVEEGWTLGVR
jgi:molybdopterin molybdotransferase